MPIKSALSMAAHEIVEIAVDESVEFRRLRWPGGGQGEQANRHQR